jgi:hypothetical protein
MSGGHIKLHRSLLLHPLTHQLPAEWFRVWVVVLLRASWKGSRWWDGTKEIDILAGSFVTSLKNLAKASGATIQQVRGALNYFETTRMVTRETTNHHTKVIVTNWETYQGSRTPDNTPDNTTGNISTTSQQQVNNNSRRSLRTEVSSTDVDELIPANAKMPDWASVLGKSDPVALG